MATDPSQNAPQLLTLKEFSSVKRLSSATIHRLIKAGKLPCYQPSGKRGKLLFHPNAIELASTLPAVQPSTGEAGHSDGKRLSGPAPKWTRQNDQHTRT